MPLINPLKRPQCPRTAMPKLSLMAIFIAVIFVAGLAFYASDNHARFISYIASQRAIQTNYIQLTLSIYLAFYAFAQLIYGPLSDRLGRRPILLIGASIFAVGCGLCAFGNTDFLYLTGRIIQGIGAGAFFMTYRATLCDCFSGNRLARVGSYFNCFFALIPLIIPLSGDFVEHISGYQSNLFLLILLTMIIVTYIWFQFPETLRYYTKQHRKQTRLRQRFAHILQDHNFLRYCLIGTFCYSSIVIFYMAAPYVFQHHTQLGPVTINNIDLLTLPGITLGAYVNAKLIAKVQRITLVRFGVLTMSLAGWCFLIFYVWLTPTFFTLIIPMFFVMFGSGFILSNVYALAIKQFIKIAGTVAGLYGFSFALTSAIISAICALLPDLDFLPIAIIIVLLTSTNVILLFFAGKRFLFVNRQEQTASA